MNESSLRIPIDDAEIIGNLAVPSAAFGLVVFAHGSGSGRHSSRNRFVAQELNRVNLATLLVDLLTEEEEISESATGHLRFDIGFLSNRLAAATRAVLNEDLPIGYFGASTGAAAALQASLQFPQAVQAIVSRGGRPDLAEDVLPKVVAPSLLVVGSRDELVLELNRQALTRLTCEKSLSVIEGATHLFEEPGTLEQVAHLAAAWFERWLRV